MPVSQKYKTNDSGVSDVPKSNGLELDPLDLGTTKIPGSLILSNRGCAPEPATEPDSVDPLPVVPSTRQPVDPWLGLSWAPFCLPQAPRASAEPEKTRRFCIGTSVLMQKRRVLRCPAELRGAWGRQKRAQKAPDHVDVSSEAPMQKHRVLRRSAAAAGAGGEGDINFVDRG